jgi:transposase
MAVAANKPVSTACGNNEPAEQVGRLRAATIDMLQAGQGRHAINTLLDVIVSLQQDNERLTARLHTAMRSRFGRRSEKLTAEELGQLVIAFGGTPEQASQENPDVPVTPVPEDGEDAPEDGEQVPENEGAAKKPRKRRKKTAVSSDVQRTIVPVPVPDDQRACVHCKGEMTPIGHVDQERIEFHPARFEIIVQRREKVACKKCRQDICTADSIPGEQARAQVATTLTEAMDTGKATREAPVEKIGSAQEAAQPVAASVQCGDEPAAEAAADAAQQASAPREASETSAIRRRAGVSLLAHLVESKCDDALPVYRQRDQFSRLGVTFPLNTLYSYWMAALAIISPVAEAVLSEVLGSDIVGVDDTKLDYLDPENRGQRRRGHLWCFVSQGALVAFDFTKTWCAEDIAPRLFAIDGFIQCDDYKGYGTKIANGAGAPRPLVPLDRRLGCLMHVRRRFHKAFKSGEKDAIIALGHIKSIYEVEAEAKQLGLDADGRLRLREAKSLKPLDDFYQWADGQRDKLRPSSYLAEAVNYAGAQRVFVERCFTDGRFELDTGRVERQIREPAVGRKNYLFSGSPKAATLLAGGYSLVCSCRNLGVPTRPYLVDVMTRLEAGFPLKRINELRPDQWAIDHGILPKANYLAQKAPQQPAG